jgi:hypothetical protein
LGGTRDLTAALVSRVRVQSAYSAKLPGVGFVSGPGVRGEGEIGVDGNSIGFGGGGGTEGPDGSFAGVRGKSMSGPGVFGAGRVGGQFRGTNAQLNLFPATTAGRPTAGFHGKGDIYMDSDAALLVCIAGGNPGTWVQVVTEALS